MISRKLITIGLCMLVTSTLILTTGCPPKKEPTVLPPPPPQVCPPHDLVSRAKSIPGMPIGCPPTICRWKECKRCSYQTDLVWD